jgi:F-type H+-transporting ATPase subunit a
VAAEAQSIDALGQFELHTVFGPIGASVNFSNSNLLMLVASAIILFILVAGVRSHAVVPGRLQALAEYCYTSIEGLCREQIGEEGKPYFPFVFTLFFFVLLGNLLGLLPFSMAYTSHLAVTGALAVLVFILSTIVAVRIHGLHFFSYFLPEGVPVVLAPLIVVIEIISYLSRPVSLSVRLFANMVAGHVMLEVLSALMLMMAGAGIFGVAAGIIPLGMNVALIGFELLVAFLQAFVFALLTMIYLHDAVHLH